MGTENRKQEIQLDVFAGSFVIEKRHRDVSDLAGICQRYAEAICQESKTKG